MNILNNFQTKSGLSPKGKSRFSLVLSSLLIICLLATSNPAAPQLITVSAKRFHQTLMISVSTGGWFETVINNISDYFAAKPTISQETQEFRNSQVDRLETKFPQEVAVGGQIQLEAIPYDIHNMTVSGIKLEWEVEKPGGEIETQLYGFLVFEGSGQYEITVKGAGKEKVSIISVIEPISLSDIQNSKKYKSEDSKSLEGQNQENLRPFEDWNPGNIDTAQNPRNQRGETPGKPKINNNFNIGAPILAVAGRAGLDLNLSLTYNSRVWTKMGQDISYDMDKDSPAPGWTLGFGKILNFIDRGIVQFDGSGGKKFFTGNVKTEASRKIFEGQSTDGSFVKARTTTNGGSFAPAVSVGRCGSFVKARTTTNGGVVNGQPCYGTNNSTTLAYPDGSFIGYTNWDVAYNSCVSSSTTITQVPTTIADKHGNYISVTYHSAALQDGRFIDYIKDTLGRIYTFNYTETNGKYYLTSISGPGLEVENGIMIPRTFVRLNYKDHTLAYNFTGLTPTVRDNNNSIKVLSSIYYPSTKTGYWFGDTDSYSPYGMIRKVEERKNLQFNNQTGVISAGEVTRSRVYSYPENTSTPISDIPEYSTVTERWSGMPDSNFPAVTEYIVDWNASPRTTSIILPYQQGKTVEYSYNFANSTNPQEKIKDAVTFKTEFIDQNNVLRAKDETTWENATLTFFTHNNESSYILPTLRPTLITHTEIDNNISLIKKSAYDSFGPYNRVLEMREIGYNGETLRKTKTQYIDKNDSAVIANNTGPRVINLPEIVEVFDGNDNRIDYTQYRYDLVNVNRIPGSTPQISFPPCPVDTNCTNDIPVNRGNLTNILKYSKVTNSTLDGLHTDGRYYDMAGNQVLFSPASLGINYIYTTYNADTGYAYPTKISQGSGTFDNSQISTTATYKYNTGLPISSIDVNQQLTTFEYDLQTWRLKKTIAPTGAYSTND